jgi:hypothetical protein
MTALTLHPRHGTHDPSSSSPARRPGAIRRTSSVDMLRPAGLTGPLQLIGRGRDARTDIDGALHVVDEATLEMTIDFLGGRTVTEFASTPDVPATAGLLGARAASGFRALVTELLPDEQEARSLLHLLLDDVPGASLISGYAVGVSGVNHLPSSGYTVVPDLCSGFRSGGTIMAEFERAGRNPLVTGPVAPSLERPDDPAGWHALDPLPATAMRRRRLLDVTPAEDDRLLVYSYFRDSYQGDDGTESVIHEYEIRAVLEESTTQVLDIVATPRVLPWVECPSAAASAQRLIGRTVHDLRREVRVEFTGTTTCTHLNDQLRELTDVLVLAPRTVRG